ncbi:hypothetical protein EVG20_g6791 [Dentipellis fragilis]|uniref:F-box domain-containing protein n=1 Tax=Dentipellis fragilis TaxID=205917 RepID=A0A4Y9YI29_9AGAM|nr:hypothetical protein EVG20_g6791 [Dentipellis fragilis]
MTEWWGSRHYWQPVALVPHAWLCNAQDSMLHLSLDSVHCDWGRLRFPAMVSLKLSYLGSTERRADIKHLPTVSMLASALATMPNLRILHLRNAISPRSLSKDSTSLSIRTPLPSLSTLKIYMDVKLCTLLLRHLAVPHEAEIDISSPYKNNEPDIRSLTAQLDEMQDHLVAIQAHAAPAFHLMVAYKDYDVVVRASGPAAGSFQGAFDVGDSWYGRRDCTACTSFPSPMQTISSSVFGRMNLKLRKAHTVTINLAGHSHAPETRCEVLFALLERGPQVMPLLETLVIRIDWVNEMPDRELFRVRLDELSSVKTIEVHAYDADDLEEVEEFMDGVRPEVRYVIWKD